MVIDARLMVQYFQFKETPDSVKAKGFTNLQALTPGSKLHSPRRF